MSSDVRTGSPRPRPLSGGFWTLLSWLRGEEHSSSNESLSSAGSDRTAVSFAFLAPAHYKSKAPPIILPPPGPPTDTYKNRVRERNLRRQYERDITLHRKYGLLRGEGVSGYDAFSLPPARRNHGSGGDRAQRERRAASECLQRRAAHVPGKRRAPPPPPLLLAPGASLDSAVVAARRHTRKRPAPQPPTKNIHRSKENIVLSCRDNTIATQMNSQTHLNEQEKKCDQVHVESDCKPEKYIRKDLRDNKLKPEKSFLKQIFDNKKRNSTVDISTVKVLPSISELDKQAAEIIENNKFKKSEEQSRLKSMRYSFTCCPKCLKDKCLCNNFEMLPSSSTHVNQNATICTQTENDLLNVLNKDKEDEKQKLKEMLKEMKDSLPKRPKHEKQVDNITQSKVKIPASLPGRDSNITETPTLRIGSTNLPQVNKLSHIVKDEEDVHNKKISNLTAMRFFQNGKSQVIEKDKQKPNDSRQTVVDKINHNKQSDTTSNENKKLHTPLKISSLLNPIYVPKNTELYLQSSPKAIIPEINHEDKNVLENVTPDPIYVKTADTVRDIILNSAKAGSPTHTSLQQLKPSTSEKSQSNEHSTKDLPKKSLSHQNKPSANAPIRHITNVERLSEHSRRRELVNQLEQSISKGDERAAADAASKLAQLRLSCSVLSFSSQILGETSTSSAKLTSPISNEHIKPSIDKAPNTAEAPLPDIVIGEVSSKITKSTQVSKDKIHSAATRMSPSAKLNDKNVVSELTSPKASTSKDITNKNEDNVISLKIWIEDKEKARGPIKLDVRRGANVGELRRRAEQYLGLPARLQRWIVGRVLCTDDSSTLISLAGPTLNAPFYLCLVESDNSSKAQVNLEHTKETKIDSKNVDHLKNDEKIFSGVYSELVNLERQALVPNAEQFECEICMEQCDPGNGVVLRECVHSFCKGCLCDVIRHCEEPAVSCPATGCPGELHEREIRALVSADEYQRWLARGLAAAESGTRNAFHCRTKDCTGWALCEIGVRRFPCPVCKQTNCVPCQAIHENQSCEQYQAKLLEATSANTAAGKTDEGTQALIDSLISRGEALQCPECSAVITKKWGCDWVKCSACKTEICWVTRGRRWGPGGRGDTTGGCRCGIDGKRCHPSCGYCH